MLDITLYFVHHLLRHCASLNYTLWIKIRTKGKMLSDFGVVISMHRIISSSDFDKLFFLLAILIFAIDSQQIIQSCNPTILFEIKGWSVCKFRHRTKETKGRSSGQTPSSIITKTSRPKKPIFNPQK